MKLHRNSAAAIVCVFILGACEQGDKAKDLNEEDSPPIPVEASLPVRGDVYAVYSGTAPIEAFAQADVIAKVPGEVKEILVEEGDDVESGQILARLDGDRLRLELNESQAGLLYFFGVSLHENQYFLARAYPFLLHQFPLHLARRPLDYLQPSLK